jgi:hypothetical protein
LPVIQVVRDRRLWIAHLPTAYGRMELLCGSGDEPDFQSLVLIERFLGGAKDHIGEVRRSAFRLPRLWRPIRFAINNDGRLGLQFKHRVTGKQDVLFFADEHSSFTMGRSDVKTSDDDLKRLKERGDLGSA